MPTVRASAITSASSATPTINMPAAIVAGELIVVIENMAGSGTVTTFTGYTLKRDLSNPHLYVYGRVATGDANDTAAPVISQVVGQAWTVLAIQDWVGVLTGFEVSTGATTNNPDLLTPSWGSAANLWLVGQGAAGGTLPSVSAWSTDYTEVNKITGDFGTDTFVGVASRVTTAVSQDPGANTVTGTPTSQRAVTMAVQPAAAGGGGGSGNLLLLGVG